MEINNNVSPTLHPVNITSLKGYAAHEPHLNYITNSFEKAYDAVVKVRDARNKLSLDTTRTKQAQVLHAADLAEKHLTQLHKMFEVNWSRLNTNISSIEKALTEPVREYAGMGVVSSEIRSHFKAMDASERRKAFNKALAAGDERTLKSVLGAPAYLSGLPDEEHEYLTRQYHEQTNPEQSERLELMKQVKAKMEAVQPVIVAEMHKALGANAAEISQLRARAAAAEAAIKFE
ncbi:MAG: hypothetical protein R3F02_18455 [Thiolinea sp.]